MNAFLFYPTSDGVEHLLSDDEDEDEDNNGLNTIDEKIKLQCLMVSSRADLKALWLLAACWLLLADLASTALG